jgi:polygalacturonase
MRKRILLLLMIVMTRGVWCQSTDTISSEIAEITRALPFAMPEVRVPAFPDLRISILDKGAVADGVTLNTKAFADAISACATSGGGTVVVPPGTWLTGSIELRSNVNLRLERGALVQFSNRIDDFPLIAGPDSLSQRFMISPPIHAYRATNIAITGDGIIDGAGEVWRYVKKEKLTTRQWKQLVASGGVVSPDGTEWWPSKEALEGADYLKRLQKSKSKPTAADIAKTREYLRPDLVHLVQCTGILLDGPTFENSPRFHIHPIQSEDIVIRNVRVIAPWYAQNADGIDPSSCRNVIIYNTTLDVGDDGFCLKPARIAQHQKPGPACENIVIENCTVYHAHGGFVIGSESYGGVRNVSVRNCVFIGTDVGLRFKSARDRGGLVEKVFIDGIQMRAIETDAILFDMYYTGGAPDAEATKDLTIRKAEPVTGMTPRFQDFSIRNVICNGADRAVVINGLPEMPIRNIRLDHVSVASTRGAFCADADGIDFDQCRFAVTSGPVMTLIQTRNVTVRGGRFPAASDRFLNVTGDQSENIHLIGLDPGEFRGGIRLGPNVRSDAVRSN